MSEREKNQKPSQPPWTAACSDRPGVLHLHIPVEQLPLRWTKLLWCFSLHCPQPHSSQRWCPAEPNAPSGRAHSAWLWPLHLPPEHWPQPPGSCGSDPPAGPAAPGALQPVDTSVQGLATPGPARPLPLPPCKEAAPEHEVPGFKEKEGLKASRWETKTQWRGQRPCQRQTQRSRQSVEAGKWLQGADGRTERPLRLAAAKEFLVLSLGSGQLLEEGSAKGYYRSVPRQAVLHVCSTGACMHRGHSPRHTGDLRNLPELLGPELSRELLAPEVRFPVPSPQGHPGWLSHHHPGPQPPHLYPGPPAAPSGETQIPRVGSLTIIPMTGPENKGLSPPTVFPSITHCA